MITPWDVSGGAGGKIDYEKLVAQFGCQWIKEDLVARVERLTGRPAHPFLKRGIFFAHRLVGLGVWCGHRLVGLGVWCGHRLVGLGIWMGVGCGLGG